MTPINRYTRIINSATIACMASVTALCVNLSDSKPSTMLELGLLASTVSSGLVGMVAIRKEKFDLDLDK